MFLACVVFHDDDDDYAVRRRSCFRYSLLFMWLYLVLPHIVPFSVDEKVRSGDSIQLNCHVSKGDKPLELNWLFNDDELSSELAMTTTKLGSSSSVLTISTVSAAHTGKYTCIASNRIGSYNYSTYINVDGTIFVFFFKSFVLLVIYRAITTQ